MVRDAIVVGCGIIGSTVAKALVDRGLDVLVLDDRRSEAGTPPSGGHLKPSWFGGMPKEQYMPAMELLDKTWGLLEERFVVRPTPITTTVYRVDTDLVMAYPFTRGTVLRLTNLTGNAPGVVYGVPGGEATERASMLVIATGTWAGELAECPKVTAKRGVSFRYATTLDRPFVKPWAPYKQVVAHQQSPGEVWVGDGSALLERSWTEQRTEDCARRCRAALKLGPEVVPTKTLHGLRPYCDSDGPCLLKRLGPSAWLATGAGKSGTIAAGWVARRVLDAHLS